MSSSTTEIYRNMDKFIQEIIATYSNGITPSLIPHIFECHVDEQVIQLRFNEAIVLKGLYQYILTDFNINGARENENILEVESAMLPIERIYANYLVQRQVWETHLENDDSFRRIVYRHLDELAARYDPSRIRPIIHKLIASWEMKIRNRMEI